MYYRILLVVFFFISFFSILSSSGQVTEGFIKENLSKNLYRIDTEAAAVILYESKSIAITKEIHGSEYSYKQNEHVYKVVKFLKSSALSAANVHVYFPENDLKNYMDGLKGKTYNLDGKEIRETELLKGDVYRKEIRKNLFEMSFSFPGVKAGSIIEYSYNIISPVRRVLPKWDIQEEYPKLISTYRISYPLDYEFTSIQHISARIKEYPFEKDAINGVDSFCHVLTKPQFPENPVVSFWLRRNVPAIKEEPYVVNLPNHVENMVLQLTGYMSYGGMNHIDNSWAKLDEELLKKDGFGTVNNKNNFLDEVVDSIKKSNPLAFNTTRAIYSYVRSNFNCSGEHNNVYSKRKLQEVYYMKQGTTAELNMLLCALLVHADIDAAPMILGTTGEMSPSQVFPAIDRFNYLACAVKTDSDYILLDASDKNNQYGVLPQNCYNGYARILKEEGAGIELSTELIKDKTVVGIKISAMTDTSAKIEITQKMGLMQSASLRRSWEKDDQKKQDYLDREIHELPENLTITGKMISNDQNPDTNIVINLSGNLKFDKDVNAFYFNSVMIKNMSQNPFKSTVRKLPIEFPYQAQYQYYLSIALPPNLEPVDLPKPTETNLDDGAMVYRKSCSYYADMHTLTVNSTFNLNVTSYPADFYDPIRTFFQNMIKQDNEIITLKKTDKK